MAYDQAAADWQREANEYRDWADKLAQALMRLYHDGGEYDETIHGLLTEYRADRNAKDS